jgi:hypothetical protein
MRQAIEGQIGMLTCQVIELQVQLQLAHGQIGPLQAEIERLRVALAATAPATPVDTQ